MGTRLTTTGESQGGIAMDQVFETADSQNRQSKQRFAHGMNASNLRVALAYARQAADDLRRRALAPIEVVIEQRPTARFPGDLGQKLVLVYNGEDHDVAHAPTFV